MDGMERRYSLTTLILVSCFVLIPLVISCVHISGAAYIQEVHFEEHQQQPVVNIPVIKAGNIHCLDIILTDETEKISIVAYLGNEIPDVENRSVDNYYRWEYDNGEWVDKSGYESSYIDSSKCKKNGNIYSFYIRLDAQADGGKWTINVSIDNDDAYTLPIHVEAIYFNILLSQFYVDRFKHGKKDLPFKFLKIYNKKCCQRETINEELLVEDIEDYIDQSLCRQVFSDQIKVYTIPSKKITFNTKIYDRITEENHIDEENNEQNIEKYPEMERTKIVNSLFKVSMKKGIIPPPLNKSHHSSIFRGGIIILISFILFSLAFIPLITSSDTFSDSGPPVVSSFTMSKDKVVNGDVIFLNVSVFDVQNVLSVKTNISSLVNINLSLINVIENTSYWQGIWEVNNIEPGNYTAVVQVKNILNLTSSQQIIWTVLETDFVENHSVNTTELEQDEFINTVTEDKTFFNDLNINLNTSSNTTTNGSSVEILSNEAYNNLNIPDTKPLVINPPNDYYDSNNGVGRSVYIDNASYPADIIDLGLIQVKAVVGKPIVWEKKILVENNAFSKRSMNINTSILDIAKNIKIHDVPEKNEINYTMSINQINENNDSKQIYSSTNIVFDRTIDALSEKVFIITFETSAPIKKEIVSDFGKRLEIQSNASIHYSNITAYTGLPELKYKPRFYRLINETRLDVTLDSLFNVTYLDNNSNGKYDGISWNVPQLSNDTYEIDITIINVQSFPALGGNWTVRFNTTGVANLTITAVNGTMWNNTNEDFDLKFLEIRSNNETLDYKWINNSVFIENYSSNETDFEISKVLTWGKHVLKFQFGDDIAYAYNYVSYEIRRPSTYTDYASTTTNPTYAYDDNSGTRSATEYDKSFIPNIEWHGWGASSTTYDTLYLWMDWEAEASTDDQYRIRYSTNNGNTWITWKDWSSSAVSRENTSIQITPAVNTSQIRVCIDSNKPAGPDNANVFIYELWTNGSYTVNLAPIQTGETPIDDSGNIDVYQAIVNVTINDPEGDTFNWTIQGTYITNNASNDDTNGSKQANLITPLPYGTNIIWYVNVTDGNSWTNQTYNFTTMPPLAPEINSYDLLNLSGSKLNSATGLIDVNNTYHFTVNITDSSGWQYIQYINITAWYDNGSEATIYNQSGNIGGNLNMFLQYENTSGSASFSMKWPDNEAELILVNCTETLFNSTTHIINISFKPLWQMRYSPHAGGWNADSGFNDLYSWNFEINVTDTVGNHDNAENEFGIYRYTYVDPTSNWVGVSAVVPGANTDTNIVSINYTSNYDFNMTVWLTGNLTNVSSGKNITVANNVKILANADPNDDITTDQTYTGTEEINAKYVFLFNENGTAPDDNPYQTVDVQFNVYVPFGTWYGIYSTNIGVKVKQKT